MLWASALATLAIQLAAADYSGQYRPQDHFSPPSGFMNDPNGLFRDVAGTWHLYYQYNPTDIVGGDQHWGHATSPDLYHWTNQPIALYPTDLGLIYTGSAVVDSANTSGFFPNQTNGVVAIYTAAGSNNQVQAIAYSTDNGYTFTQYSGNPVLEYSEPNFRDPKVIWHDDTNQWVMVVAYSDQSEVAFYTSPNLIDWTLGSVFTYTGQGGGATECPNITPIPFIPQGSSSSTGLLWLLWVSQGGGSPLGGTWTQYYVGSFNGTHFNAFEAVRPIEFGRDNYAAQLWDFSTLPTGWKNTGVPGIGWASNGLYADSLPTGTTEGWVSCDTAPRRYHVTNSTFINQDYALVAEPYNLEPVKGGQLAHSCNLTKKPLQVIASGNSTSAGTFLIQASVTGLSSASTDATLNFTILSSTSGESLSAIQTFDGSNEFVMSRANTRGFNDSDFTSPDATTNLGSIQSYDLTMLLDRSIWEVFLMHGHRVATDLYYTTEGAMLDTVIVHATGFSPGAHVCVKVSDLNSTWVD